MTDSAPEGLAYCPNLSQRTGRLRRLYNRQAQDEVFAIMEIPRKTVAAFAKRYSAGECPCPAPEERARYWDAYWRESASVLDDRVPAAYLTELDQGLYAGLVGGKARFTADPSSGWISSMVPPLLSDWKELDGLRWDEEGEWARRYAHILNVFVRAARGRFGVSHFILIDSLNFIFELFGATRTYLSLDEEPERVRQAMEFAFGLNAWVQDRFFDAVPLVEGGTCSLYMASWIPGRIVMESLDPFHMTSVDCLLQWGVAPAERILARYDGGVTHIHANGRRLIEAACTIKGLRGIVLGDDLGFPSAFDVLPEIRRRAGEMPLMAGVPYPKFVEALRAHRLVGGVLYVVSGTPDRDSANRAMDEVRGYRASS